MTRCAFRKDNEVILFLIDLQSVKRLISKSICTIKFMLFIMQNFYTWTQHLHKRPDISKKNKTYIFTCHLRGNLLPLMGSSFKHTKNGFSENWYNAIVKNDFNYLVKKFKNKIPIYIFSNQKKKTIQTIIWNLRVLSNFRRSCEL